MSATLAVPAPTLAPSAAAATTSARRRLDAIDLLRGLVIVIMVLDHVRDFWSRDAFLFAPTDIAQTTPALFLTRWITHLCAPTFVFLAGASAWLQRRAALDRGEPLGGVARFLVTRGLWLVLLDATLVTFALHFGEPFVFLEVIWAIGVGLASLGLLLAAPPAAVLALGIATVVGHQALAAMVSSALLRFWLMPGPLGGAGVVAYPALPWMGVMWMGYGLGAIWTREGAARRRALVATGGAMLAAFVLVRLANGYGDLVPWAVQPRGALFTVLSFLNVTKYPPSLDFVLVALGCSLPLGALLDATLAGRDVAVARVLRALGRAPLFTFVVHLYVVHALAMLVGVLQGVPASAFTHFLDGPARPRASGWGVSLPIVYLVWVLVVAAMYPLARRVDAAKTARARWWLRYV